MPPRPLPESHPLRTIREATWAARDRTGKNICTRIQSSTAQAQIGIAQDIGKRGAVHFEPLTQWMSLEEATQHLSTLQ